MTKKKNVACIVLPTYNEADNIKILLPKVFEQKQKIASHELHVLVVDDNSPDGTADVVKRMISDYKTLHLITGEKEGLGAAYQRGMKYAAEKLNAEIILQMDADLQHDPLLIPLFISLHTFGFTVVIGSRFLPGGSTPNFGFYRKAISLVGNTLIRFLGGLPRLHDFTSGYRAIDAALIQKCDLSNLSIRGYSFQTSLLFELIRNGAKVLEIPITFREREHGNSKLAFRDQYEFVVNLGKIRFGKYYDFVRYIIVGISGLVLNLAVYIGITRFLNSPPWLAAILAIESSVLSNFLIDNLWQFKGHYIKGILKRVGRFHINILPGITLNYGMLLILFYGFGFWDIGSMLLGIAGGAILNYGWSAFRSWKQ